MRRLNQARVSLIVALLIVSSARAEITGTGLQISATGDFAGGFGLYPSAGGPTRFLLFREAELMAFSPADYLFDGRVTLAAENDGGIIEPVLHEAFIGSSRLIPRSRFRLGLFFLGIGRLNPIHRHDWPFIATPKVNSEIFNLGEQEGVADLAFEYSWLLPTSLYLDLTLGIASGWTYGHVHGTAGNAPQVPTHYARLMTYLDLPGENAGMQLGINYLGRKNEAGIQNLTLGADLVMKWRQNQRLLWLVQSEFWFKKEIIPSATNSVVWGAYLFAQHAIGQRTFLGARGDFFKTNGSNDFTLGITPQISVQPSEFTTFRVDYKIESEFQGGTFFRTNHFVELQAVFILGSHPAHEF